MKDKRTSRRKCSIGDEIIEGLEGFRDALRAGEPIEQRFTMRTVELELDPRRFTAREIKELRELMHASQAVFAKLIGVAPATLQSWEQGRQEPPAWGRRLLELMKQDPEPWRRILERAAKVRAMRA